MWLIMFIFGYIMYFYVISKLINIIFKIQLIVGQIVCHRFYLVKPCVIIVIKSFNIHVYFSSEVGYLQVLGLP